MPRCLSIQRRLALAIFLAIAANPAAAEEFDVAYNQIYVERDSGPLKADMYVPHGEGPFPAVLVVHGGAWRMGSRAQLLGVARQLAAHGYTAAAISYRLAPDHKFPAQIEDCKAAVRWMRTNATQWKIDPDRVGAFGYSAGAQLVTLLGTTDVHDGMEGIEHPENFPNTRLQAVVAGGAPCEFRTLPPDARFLEFWLGGSPAEAPQQYVNASPRAFVTSDDPPMFLFHGGNDTMVPLISAEKMRESLVDAGIEAELYIAPEIGHLAAAGDRQCLARSLAFFDRHLKSQPLVTQRP